MFQGLGYKTSVPLFDGTYTVLLHRKTQRIAGVVFYTSAFAWITRRGETDDFF